MRRLVAVVEKALWSKAQQLPSRTEGVLFEALEKSVRSAGDPVKQIIWAVIASRLYEDARIDGMSSALDTGSVEDTVRTVCMENLAPLHPILCFLREQRREIIQRAFEEQEASIDRRPPDLAPEIPIFFVSKREEDDALWPEEREEAIKRRKLRIAAKKRKKTKEENI